MALVNQGDDKVEEEGVNRSSIEHLSMLHFGQVDFYSFHPVFSLLIGLASCLLDLLLLVDSSSLKQLYSCAYYFIIFKVPQIEIILIKYCSTHLMRMTVRHYVLKGLTVINECYWSLYSW